MTIWANRAYSVPKGVRNKENIKHLFDIIFSCYFVIPNPLKQKKSIGDLVNPIFFIFTQFLWCKCNARHAAFFEYLHIFTWKIYRFVLFSCIFSYTYTPKWYIKLKHPWKLLKKRFFKKIGFLYRFCVGHYILVCFEWRCNNYLKTSDWRQKKNYFGCCLVFGESINM